jgi:hypothetical protein
VEGFQRYKPVHTAAVQAVVAVDRDKLETLEPVRAAQVELAALV